MNGRSLLTLAALAGAALTVTVFGVRIVGVGPDRATPDALLPALVAAGSLCVVGLTVGRAPSTAWLAVIVALTTVTLDLAAFGRANRADLGPTGWPWLVILVTLGAMGASGAAAAYATMSGRRSGVWIGRVAVLAFASVVIVSVGVVATIDERIPAPPDSPLGNLVLVTRTLLAVVLALTAIGVVADLRPAIDRTRGRLSDAAVPQGPARVAAAARIFMDELAPGRGRARRAAAAERSRIAAELHADVVPAVRRALSEAEQGGSSERLAVALRDVLGEVDGLVEARHSVVLEELGLLAALEWLAERTEERSDVRVVIDVVGMATTTVPGPRPTKAVEAAAFRVAQLALDNVVRHAPAASAWMELTSEPGRLRLVIRDDGPGLESDASRLAAASGRRGLADMRAEAQACGGSLAVETADGAERGTVVRFDWPAA